MVYSYTLMRIQFNNFETGAAASQAGQSFLARCVGLFAPRKQPAGGRRTTRRCGGFTLEEVLVSMAISAITIAEWPPAM